MIRLARFCLIWLSLLPWGGLGAWAASTGPLAAADTVARAAGAADTAATTAVTAARADTARAVTDSAGTTVIDGEVVGPDDVGSPVVLLLLLLVGVALALACLCLALVGAALAVGALLLATGLVSATAVLAASRKTTWAGRGTTFLRVAAALGGLLGGAALGEGAHLLWPLRVGPGLGPAGGATAGLGAALLLAALLLQLARAAGRWAEAHWA